MADTFKNRFIQAMNIRGMRQVDVVKKSGLDKAQISQYKTGKYEPTQDALYKLATALNVNVAWLMGHDVPMETSYMYLEQKVATCELSEKCYDSKAYEMVELFAQLDYIDKVRMIERAHTLLENEKYSAQKESASP